MPEAILYPLPCPPHGIALTPNLDFLLLDMPPRYLPMMPYGIGYVHNILEKMNIKHQTMDLSIYTYHKYHEQRLMHPNARLPDGSPYHDDPWANTSLVLQQPQSAVFAMITGMLEEVVSSITASPPRIVGVSLNGNNRDVGHWFLRRVREVAPQTVLLVGGYDCTHEHAGRHAALVHDYMVVGEAESSLPELVRQLLQGKQPVGLPGVVCRAHMDAPFIPATVPENIDDVPFPTYPWCHHALYQDFTRHHLVPVALSRGCRWGRCRFCGECLRFRKRKIHHVIAELRHWVDLGFHSFHFNESDVNGDPEHLKKLCEAIVHEGWSLSCLGQLRIDKCNTPEYFVLLAKAGFRHLRFGVDGWSQGALRLMRKGYTLATVKKNLQACREAGIFTTVNMVLGVPGETEQDIDEAIVSISEMKDSINLVESMNTHMLIIASEYMRDYEKYNIHFREDLSSILQQSETIVPEHLWYSENPYIDQEVRRQRLQRIVVALHENGVQLGDFAAGIVQEHLANNATLTSEFGSVPRRTDRL